MMILSRLRVLAAMGLLSTLSLSACAPAPQPATESAHELSGELTVFAAASLGPAFDEVANEFEALHPQLEILPISYDGSSVLATQLIEGAPADVFASADRKNMHRVAEAGLADGEPVDFATNMLEIAVAPGNPLGIESLENLADGKSEQLNGREISVALCAEVVPCGAAARTLIAKAEITITPASEEQNVSAVLFKVRSGEADAGFVYVTDTKAAANEVDGIAIEGADAATNVYPIVSLAGSDNPGAAAAFLAFVASVDGRRVLSSFGFGAP